MTFHPQELAPCSDNKEEKDTYRVTRRLSERKHSYIAHNNTREKTRNLTHNEYLKGRLDSTTQPCVETPT